MGWMLVGGVYYYLLGGKKHFTGPVVELAEGLWLLKLTWMVVPSYSPELLWGGLGVQGGEVNTQERGLFGVSTVFVRVEAQQAINTPWTIDISIPDIHSLQLHQTSIDIEPLIEGVTGVIVAPVNIRVEAIFTLTFKASQRNVITVDIIIDIELYFIGGNIHRLS